MTWVRAPGPHYFHIIFQSKFLCSVNAEDTSYAFKIRRPRVPIEQSEGQELRNTMDCSQRVYTLVPKSTRPGLFGLKFLGYTSTLGTDTPKVCQILLFFLSFLLFLSSFNYYSFNPFNIFHKYKKCIKIRKDKKYNKYFYFNFSCK